MRYGLALLALALTPLALAIQLAPSGAAAALALAGLGLIAPALAWMLGRPGLFGKRSDGRMPAWTWIAHGSYRVLAHTTFNLVRGLSGERPYDVVAPGVLLGRRLARGERRLAEEAGVAGVLDLTAEFPGWSFGRPYRCLPVLDGCPVPPAQIAAAVAWLREAPRPVYVHCAQGHGRSAVVAAAWLLAEEPGLGVDDAVARVKAARPGIGISGAQREALRAWREGRG